MNRSRYHRRNSWRWGKWSEIVCAWVLRFKGYRILAHRYRTPVGEIDLIAYKGGNLVFVEVKARKSIAQGLEAITSSQRRRIEKAAELYCAYHQELKYTTQRIDVMIISSFRWPVHFRNAWILED